MRPILYGKKIPLDARQTAGLLRTLRTPRIVDLVTELRVDMRRCDVHDSLLPPFIRGSCYCDRTDALLGLALVSLSNLQVLHFTCQYNREPDENNRRHLYLEKLKSTQLRELVFECRCTSPSSDNPYHIFAAACMRSVQSFKWMMTSLRTVPKAEAQSLLMDPRTLAKVSRVMCDNTEPLEGLLSKGNITHLACYNINDRVRAILEQYPGSLVHLRTRAGLEDLYLFISRNPKVYGNLRHIGGITLSNVSRDRIQSLVDLILSYLDREILGIPQASRITHQADIYGSLTSLYSETSQLQAT
jgi:hypothetical protein